MKFKNKTTGAVLKTNDKFVIEQLSKAEAYEEVKEIVKEKREDKKSSK